MGQKINKTQENNDSYFYATRSANFNTTTATITTFAYNTIAYDPSSTYNNSTYRWTPGVAGMYLIQANALISASTPTRAWLTIRRTGTEVARSADHTVATSGVNSMASAVWFGFLDTTDYVDVAYFSATSSTISSAAATNFSGVLIRRL